MQVVNAQRAKAEHTVFINGREEHEMKINIIQWFFGVGSGINNFVH